MNDKQIQLDDQAAKLFKEFGGLEESDVSSNRTGLLEDMYESIGRR